MKIFKYSISRKYKAGVMQGRIIHGYAKGYVFAETQEEAIRMIETKYPSCEQITQDFSYEETSFIEI